MNKALIVFALFACMALAQRYQEDYTTEDTPVQWQGAIIKGRPQEVDEFGLNYFCGVDTRYFSYTSVDKSFGCHKGYCWRACSNLPYGQNRYLLTSEWCYTKKVGTSGARKCSRDADCDPCWQCSGACTL